MSDGNETTVTISTKVVQKMVELNREARKAIEPAGGNSIQDGYRNACIGKIDEQYQLLEIFDPDN